MRKTLLVLLSAALSGCATGPSGPSTQALNTRALCQQLAKVGIPTKKTTGSDAWRPSVPIDDDRGARVRGGTVGYIC
jgi:hypothetical protein